VGTRLLTTKLYIPPPRPRLIERLNAGLHRKPTLVSGPAGFGKTTLLGKQTSVGVRPPRLSPSTFLSHPKRRF